mmetsp:Transcript_55768/g.118623  ORF Transcript_55768/g.118623 Transcript_55768/m.118623 type:complete len:275 (-) Transcript_55768:46-870(-)
MALGGGLPASVSQHLPFGVRPSASGSQQLSRLLSSCLSAAAPSPSSTSRWWPLSDRLTVSASLRPSLGARPSAYVPLRRPLSGSLLASVSLYLPLSVCPSATSTRRQPLSVRLSVRPSGSWQRLLASVSQRLSLNVCLLVLAFWPLSLGDSLPSAYVPRGMPLSVCPCYSASAIWRWPLSICPSTAAFVASQRPPLHSGLLLLTSQTWALSDCLSAAASRRLPLSSGHLASKISEVVSHPRSQAVATPSTSAYLSLYRRVRLLVQGLSHQPPCL